MSTYRRIQCDSVDLWDVTLSSFIVISEPGSRVFALLAQTSDKQAQEVIERGLELLSTPGGVGAVAVLTILLAGGVVTQSGWRWLLISLLVLATLIQGSTKYFNNTLFPPLEQLRSGSQVLNALASVRGRREHWLFLDARRGET